jgi:hypothetical protein
MLPRFPAFSVYRFVLGKKRLKNVAMDAYVTSNERKPSVSYFHITHKVILTFLKGTVARDF